MLLALRYVRAVGDEDRDDRHGEQERRGGLHEQDSDDEQRKAGIGERDDRAHQQHAWDPGVLGGAFREGDRGGHREHPDHVLGGCRQERRGPFERAERRPEADQDLDDADRDHRAEQELSEIEAELDRPLPPADDQREGRADQAGHDELGRPEEEEPVDQRDLAHREGVGTSTDVQVNDLGFGQIEETREGPPGDRERCLERLPGRHFDHRQCHRHRAEQHGQRPDARRAGRRRSEPAKCVAECRAIQSGRAQHRSVRMTVSGTPR